MAYSRPLGDLHIIQQVRNCLLDFENCTGQIERVFGSLSSSCRFRLVNLKTFQHFLQDYSEIFIVSGVQFKTYVSLTTQLTVCPQHSRKSGSCQSPPYLQSYRSCDCLHVCVFHLLSGICEFGDKCFFGHSLQTSHNQSLLHEHFLDGLDIDDLRAIFTLPYVRHGVTRPQVCRFYNSPQDCGKYEGSKFFCKSLHICRHYVINDCRYGVDCNYNHDVIGNEQVEEVLELYGVSTNRRPKLILEDLFLYMQEDDDQVLNHERWLKTHVQFSQEPARARTASVPNLPQAISASSPGRQHTGSPARGRSTQLCKFYQQGRCRFGDSCRYLHSSQTSSPAPSPTRMLEALLSLASISGAGTGSNPSYWDQMQGKECVVVKLSSSDPRTAKEFAKKQTMERKYGEGRANELYLFHGTPTQSVIPILHQNIDPLLAGSNVGAIYGRGAYFAVDSHFSDSYSRYGSDGSDHLYMFYARVLAGQVTKGEKTMQRPPPRNASDPNSLFDAVVDNVKRPRIYVIFRNQQIYPEYLIRYQR